MWLHSPRVWSAIILVAAAILFLCCIYFSPWWAMREIRQAALVDNVEAMSEYMNFPQLQSNLESQIRNQVTLKLASMGKANDIQAQNEADLEAEKIIQTIVTPVGVTGLLHWIFAERSPKEDLEEFLKQKNANALTDQNGVQTVAWTDGYVSGSGWNQFDINILNTQGGNNQTITVQLTRQGFFSWKVINVLIPLGF